MSRFTKGIICALAGASCWGFSGACGQFLIEGYGASPLFLTMVRMLGAGALFLALLAATQRDNLLAALRDREARFTDCVDKDKLLDYVKRAVAD